MIPSPFTPPLVSGNPYPPLPTLFLPGSSCTNFSLTRTKALNLGLFQSQAPLEFLMQTSIQDKRAEEMIQEIPVQVEVVGGFEIFFFSFFIFVFFSFFSLIF